MRPISIIKENTGVLSREKLEQTGYGMLCQAFAMQILNGMSVTDGLYQQLALEFPEDQEPVAPAENVYRISLNLVLETLRKLEPSGEAERVRTERLLKRLETRIREQAEGSPAIAPQERPAMRSPAITQNNFLFQALLQLSKTGKDAGNQPTLAGVLLRAEAAAHAAAGEGASGRTDVSDLGRGGALTGPGRGAGTGFRGGISAAGFPTGGNVQAFLPTDAETVLLVEGTEPTPGGKSELTPAKIAADAERTLERHLREITRPQNLQTGREAKKATQKAEMKSTGERTARETPAANAQSHRQAEAAAESAGAIQAGEHGLPEAAASDRMRREESTAAPRPHGIAPVGRDIRTAAPVVEYPMEPAHLERQELTLAEASPVSTGERAAEKTAAEAGVRERSAEKTVGKTAARPAERAAIRENAEQAASAAAPSSSAASAKLKSEKPTAPTAPAANAQSHRQAEAAAESAGTIQAGEHGLPEAAASDRMRREESTAAPRPHGIAPVGRDIRTAAPVVEHPMEPAHLERQELTLAEASPVSTGERAAGKTAAEAGAEHVREHGIRERFTGKTAPWHEEILPSVAMELRLEKQAAMEAGFPAPPVKPTAPMEGVERAAGHTVLEAQSSQRRARRPDASKLNSRAEFRSTHIITQVSRDIRAVRRFTGENPFGAAGLVGPSYADTDVPELEYATGTGQNRQNLKPAAPEMDSEYVRSLPDWAQNFLKNSRASAPGTVPADIGGNPGGMISGTARNISVLPGPAAGTEQVQWTAPQRRPAELSLRQKEEKQVERRPEKPSDTEIRHMADKVYKLIEERIRRERRMLDF